MFLGSIQFVKAQDASLYPSPSSGVYAVGDIFSVAIKVNSGGKIINAAEGVLSFNPSILKVITVSRTDSIFHLWTAEPTFSNIEGTISFGGGTTASFQGASGNLFSITFQARAVGTASLKFSSGSVLAADYKGTNILKNMGVGSFVIQPRIVNPAEGAPLAPIISSPTHPEQEEWYSSNSPKFTWVLPSDVVGVSLLLDKRPLVDPGSISDGLMEQKQYEGLEEGTWYFHIKFKNQSGWGGIARWKLLIDTTPPNSFKVEVKTETPTDPQPSLVFNTSDELSGIGYFEIVVDAETSLRLTETLPDDRSYQLPPQTPGKHMVEVIAFDKAGNFTKEPVEIEILPIETPVITKYPVSLEADEPLSLEGESLPGVRIEVFADIEGKESVLGETEADQKGKWSFRPIDPLEDGRYQVWARARDSRGALSLSTPKVNLLVGLPTIFRFGSVPTVYLNIMIALIIIVVELIIVFLYAWYRISLWRKRMKKETREIRSSVVKSFNGLRKEVEQEVDALSKRKRLTKSEKELRDKIVGVLDTSEERINKEIGDVEKELK